MYDRTLGITDGTADLRIAAVERALPVGLILVEDWPTSAAESLVAGADSPLLRELAGLTVSTPVRDIRDLADRTIDQFGFVTPPLTVAVGLVADICCAWVLGEAMTTEEAISRIGEMASDPALGRPDRDWDELVGIWWDDPPSVRVPSTRWRQKPNWKPMDGEDLTGWRRQWKVRADAAIAAFVDGRDVATELVQATNPSR